MIIYSDKIPSRFDGWTIGFVSIIRPAFRDDVGLHEHEAAHREQFWRNPIKSMLYKFNRKIRLEMEVEAYKAQIAKLPKDSGAVARFAVDLSSHYDLGITYKEALRLLR